MNYLIISLILSILVINTSFSNEKKYLPIEEKQRHLSLPPKTWKIDAGVEYYFGMENDSFEFEFDANLINFQFPYLPIGNRTELYFFTPILKHHAIKNVSEQDNSIITDGANLAFLGGLTGIYYSSKNGFGISYGIGYQYKNDTGKSSWFFSNGLGIFNLDFNWETRFSLGTGFQIAKKFAIILAIDGSLYEYIVHYLNTEIEESYIGYTIKVPIDFKINKNRKNGFMIRTGFKYRANTFNNESFIGIPIGIQYSWHW